MGRFLIKLDGPQGPRYLEWSTVTDSPITHGMTLDGLRAYIKQRYGEEGLGDLDARLARVEATGTSVPGSTLADELVANRAGPDESELTAEEIYVRYCLDEEPPR